MASTCAKYTCGCTCGAEHDAVPDGPPVQFTKPWSGTTDTGSPLAVCHSGLTFVRHVSGAHWVHVTATMPPAPSGPPSEEDQ